MGSRKELSDEMTGLPPDPTDPRARVRAIMDMMARGVWERGTPRRLAATWDCQQRTIELYASQASTHLTLLGDREAIIQRVIERVDRVLESDRGGDVVAAGRLLLEAVGAIRREKATDPESLSEQEHEARLVRIFERPDRVTERALRRAGWARLEVSGEEVSGG